MFNTEPLLLWGVLHRLEESSLEVQAGGINRFAVVWYLKISGNSRINSLIYGTG